MSFSVLNNILLATLLILGFAQLGALGMTFYKRTLGYDWPIQFAGQNLLLGFAISGALISWLSLIAPQTLTYQVFGVSLMLLGVIFIAAALRGIIFKIRNLPSIFKSIQGIRLPILVSILIALLYIAANYGPVTNGDSLDYHLGYAYNFLRLPLESFPDWYNGRMAQGGGRAAPLRR
jgi:hypothetical protein